MVIRTATVKSVLWFCAILLSALSFPIQVINKSPYPSLLPYAIIILIFGLNILARKPNAVCGVNRRRNYKIRIMINIYLFLFFLNTGWQTFGGVISLNESASAFAIYLFPVVFYFYFRRSASEKEVRSVLLGIVVAGLIVGIFFSYDSYLKLALGQVSDYAKEAFEYSLQRENLAVGELSESRINPGWRSFGLLETHSVSGGYIVLSSIAALALLPLNRGQLRRAVVVVFGTMLLMSLNFTAIIAFSLIIFVIEFNGFRILSGRLYHKDFSKLALLSILFLLVALIASVLAGDVMSDFISTNLSLQTALLFGTGDASSLSMANILIGSLGIYAEHIVDYPPSLLIGDGFSKFGMLKGGDVGLIDSLGRFGLPYLALIIFGFIRLIKAGLRKISNEKGALRKEPLGLNDSRIMQFAVGAIFFVLITEGHYSVWVSKAISPIIFFTLALFERYLPDYRSRSPSALNGRVAAPSITASIRSSTQEPPKLY